MKKPRAYIHDFRWALAHANIPPKHERLLGHIAVFAKDYGGDSRPGYPRLAKMGNMSERSVERYVSHLKAAGWLAVTKQACSSGRATVFQLAIGHSFKLAVGKPVRIEEPDWNEQPKYPPKPALKVVGGDFDPDFDEDEF